MKTPWHLWLIGILRCSWNAGGAFDYVMIANPQQRLPGAAQPRAARLLRRLPVLGECSWALGVWGAVLGSVLLLLRSRFAVHAFVLSFVGMAGNFAWGYLISATPMTEMMADAGLFPLVFTVAIVVVAIAAHHLRPRMAQKGQLR